MAMNAFNPTCLKRISGPGTAVPHARRREQPKILITNYKLGGVRIFRHFGRLQQILKKTDCVSGEKICSFLNLL